MMPASDAGAGPDQGHHAIPIVHTENTTSTPLTPQVAAGFLADLGFLIVPSVPSRSIDGFLLVALRDHPTLRHYDPEEADYWIDAGLHGCPMTLWRGTKMPIHDAFSWGIIRIVDRLHVTNDFLTFGGTMRAEDVRGTAVVVFRSSAPMLRMGGHSQVADEAAVPLATFFGRLRGAMTVSPAAEQRVIGADPMARYAAFICDGASRFEKAPILQGCEPAMWHLFQTERARLQQEPSRAWGVGEELAAIALPVPAVCHHELHL